MQEPWQFSSSPVMITKRTRINRKEMERYGTKPKALEVTETLPYLKLPLITEILNYIVKTY